ncbi:MAG: methylmalonyl Co-A mutase-associated GTPase MeaB [Alphaproteobacteria bacterium]|nr:methylmalonyl Co-A mutase-associated GTPase MeaB [Alphaproteobacteria bacterium]
MTRASSPHPVPLPQAGEGGIDSLRIGGKSALAAALSRLEEAPETPETLALLDAAYAAPRAHVVGITGPPGVGKSTLIGALIAAWRKAGRSVAIIAVDPSSRLSGGALLGDRMRLRTDPEDRGVFVRSMAARDRLGGLAAQTLSAMVVMRALFDIVVIETVGVGQSETDIAGAADTVVLCIQPGSGDSLQFMKAGIVEIPHLMLVTKADTGSAAEQARVDAATALHAGGRRAAGEWRVQVLTVSAASGSGVPELVAALDEHRDWLGAEGRLAQRRLAQEHDWFVEAVRERFGREGLRRAGPDLASGIGSPFRRLALLGQRLGG